MGSFRDYKIYQYNENHENQIKLKCKSQIELKSFHLPGSLVSANDQLDKGPVMLRTATHTSFKELPR